MSLQTIATFSVARMINWILLGFLMALFAEAMLRLLRRTNSGTRFAVWFSALVGTTLVPIADLLIPQSVLSDPGTHAKLVLPSFWALYVMAAWATLAVFAVMRLGFGLWQVRNLRRASVRIPLASLDPVLRSRLQERQHRRVILYENPSLRVPVAIGFLPPAIILPSWTLNELTIAELEAVLLHELAHIDRYDDWTNLAQKVAGAIFFFNPAIWWIKNRLSLEREMACDDIVLHQMANPREYAHCLVSLVEKSFLRRGLVLAQTAVARMGQTARRISQILDANRPGATAIWKPALALVASFALVSLFVAGRTPQLIAFGLDSHIVATGAREGVSRAAKQLLATGRGSPDPNRNVASLSATSSNASARPVQLSIADRSASREPVAWPARFVQKQRPRSRPQLAQAHTNDPERTSMGSDAYLVVVQTRFAPSGAVYWSIGVVQLTVFRPGASRIQPDFPPKSI